MKHPFAMAAGLDYLRAVVVSAVVAGGLVAGDALVAQSPISKYSTAPPPGWKVPRLADGTPDLQGVWGNNAVTPMTRPSQWKDKTALTDAEVDELQALPRQVRRRGR